jgi:hypothetical protein
MPDRSIPIPPPIVTDIDGEYVALLAGSAAEAVEIAKRECGYEPDQLHPVEVKLTPVGGTSDFDVFWSEDVALTREQYGSAVAVLGDPVDYWRVRDGC